MNFIQKNFLFFLIISQISYGQESRQTLEMLGEELNQELGKYEKAIKSQNKVALNEFERKILHLANQFKSELKKKNLAYFESKEMQDKFWEIYFKLRSYRSILERYKKSQLKEDLQLSVYQTGYIVDSVLDDFKKKGLKNIVPADEEFRKIHAQNRKEFESERGKEQAQPVTQRKKLIELLIAEILGLTVQEYSSLLHEPENKKQEDLHLAAFKKAWNNRKKIKEIFVLFHPDKRDQVIKGWTNNNPTGRFANSVRQIKASVIAQEDISDSIKSNNINIDNPQFIDELIAKISKNVGHIIQTHLQESMR